MSTKQIISRSTIAANAAGEHSSASHTVTHQASVQDEYKKQIAEAQTALISDQDSLDELDAEVHDALGQFLRIARQIEITHSSLAEAQERVKALLDAVWIEKTGDKLARGSLPANLSVVKAMLSSPVLAAAIKLLV
jgi:G3E family GTPase